MRYTITTLLAFMLLIATVTPTTMVNANSQPLSGKGISSWAGLWVDQALVEQEDEDGSLRIEYDKKNDALNVTYDAWFSGESYTFRPLTTLTLDGDHSGTFTYEFDEYDQSGIMHTRQGQASVQLTSGAVVLQMDVLPSEVKSQFRPSRNFIRDPYGNQTYRTDDAIAILSKACQCKESSLVKFQFPVADNEGIKPWVRYISVDVRGHFLTEYRVDLHKRTAEKLKDAWSNMYQHRSDVRASLVTASSTLPKSKSTSYQPSQVVDGDTATCWCEGTKGKGVGQSFTITLAQKTALNGILILPGYGKSVAAFLENGSVRKAKLTFSDGSSYIADFTKGSVFDLSDQKIITRSITFKILEVTPGSKYEDTCVSEVAWY
ncbi:discoidin domain-containing protein [Paenibacillus guangzhouensis]|uniref:discoidin domain-containing protein n=1 Tax=Paenibacillus guangzhouensis TaxID=1473112 RepID=UPI00187B58A7|nr:discoidin domain-containing protein [Paenibacillus guangzhouensis]